MPLTLPGESLPITGLKGQYYNGFSDIPASTLDVLVDHLPLSPQGALNRFNLRDSDNSIILLKLKPHPVVRRGNRPIRIAQLNPSPIGVYLPPWESRAQSHNMFSVATHRVTVSTQTKWRRAR